MDINKLVVFLGLEQAFDENGWSRFVRRAQKTDSCFVKLLREKGQ